MPIPIYGCIGAFSSDSFLDWPPRWPRHVFRLGRGHRAVRPKQQGRVEADPGWGLRQRPRAQENAAGFRRACEPIVGKVASRESTCPLQAKCQSRSQITERENINLICQVASPRTPVARKRARGRPRDAVGGLLSAASCPTFLSLSISLPLHLPPSVSLPPPSLPPSLSQSGFYL